jgi:hypothetical protein
VLNARRGLGPSLRGCWDSIRSSSSSITEDLALRVTSIDPNLALRQAGLL